MADYSMHPGGTWIESQSGARLEAGSPAMGEPIGRVPEERGGGLVAGGARAGGFPTDLYCEATVLERVSEEMRWRARRPPVPSRPDHWERHPPLGSRSGSRSRVGGRFSPEAFTELETVVLNLG